MCLGQSQTILSWRAAIICSKCPTLHEVINKTQLNVGFTSLNLHINSYVLAHELNAVGLSSSELTESETSYASSTFRLALRWPSLILGQFALCIFQLHPLMHVTERYIYRLHTRSFNKLFVSRLLGKWTRTEQFNHVFFVKLLFF